MAVYLKKFETQAAYEAAQSGLILPNVSYTVDNNTVHYNPYVEPVETRVVVKYNVTSTISPTKLVNNTNSFSEIDIDGIIQQSVVSEYTFKTTGEHTVKYTLTDPTSIGSVAFNGCSSLTSIYIPDSVTTIGQSAFQSCTSLKSINIPSGVTSIGDFAFSDCSGLTSCTIGSGVTSIGQSAFARCTSLTGINIPSGVTSIGSRAFQACGSLTSITVNATTPPTLSNVNAFVNTNDCPIYVPSGSVDAYKAATNWSSLASRIQAIS